MTLCAFLAPEIPRTLPGEYPDLLPDPLGSIVSDPLAYNTALRVLGQFSMVTLTPSTIAVHRLVQAAIRARLDRTEEQTWAQRAVAVIRAGFPNAGWQADARPGCERLLPHLLVVVEHAERLDVAGEQAGWLLDRAATYLRERGQYRQALPLAQRALTVTQAALGSDHVEVGWRCDELGLVLRALGDLTGARAQHERALQISEAALGPDHPTIGIWWRSSLGRVLQDLGDLPGARTQHERALQISEAVLGLDTPLLASGAATSAVCFGI